MLSLQRSWHYDTSLWNCWSGSRSAIHFLINSCHISQETHYIATTKVCYNMYRVFYKINREGLLLKIEVLIKTLSLWGIYQCVTIHSLCAPFQTLMVMTNPHYYGFIILTVWCVMCECVVLTSIPFTLDQTVFTERKHKLTRKNAFYRILFSSYIAVLFFGLGSLTFSVVLLLHLSKNGQKTHSFTGSVYFILRYTLLPFFLTFMKTYVKKLKIIILLLFSLNH